jgi:hypothetical protein
VIKHARTSFRDVSKIFPKDKSNLRLSVNVGSDMDQASVGQGTIHVCSGGQQKVSDLQPPELHRFLIYIESQPAPHNMPLGSTMRLTSNLPSTLIIWRDYNTSPTFAVWEPLRSWFLSEGLHIFEVTGSTTVKPAVNELRAHDGTYSTHYGPPNITHEHRVREHASYVPFELKSFAETSSLHRSNFRWARCTHSSNCQG